MDPQNRPKNHIFQLIEGEIPVLMDPMPATDIIAVDDSFKDKADVLDAVKDHIYREQNIFLKDVLAIRSMLKTGSGFQFIDYDPDGEGGEGSVTVRNMNRKQIVKDPAADTIDQSRYLFIDDAISNDDLRRLYPKTAEKALSQPLKDKFIYSGTKSRENQNTGSGSKDTGRYESKDMTFIELGFLRDYALEEIPDDETQIQLTEESAQLHQGVNPDISKWEDHKAHVDGHKDQKAIIAAEALQTQPELVTEEDIQRLKDSSPDMALMFNIIDDHIEMHLAYIESMDESEVGKRPKYPNNLRLIVKTGNVIHFDGAPDVDDGMIPLVEFECYKDDGPAEGAIKHLIPMQKTLNELDAKELRGLKRNANSGWLKDEESEVDEDTLTDEDGIVITKKQGTEVVRLPPGEVSVQLANRVAREYEAMQRVEGVGEAVLGEAPKHVTSGVSLRRLQMQSLGRIRLKSKMIENAIERRDKLIIKRAHKHYSTERKLRTEDHNGKIHFIKYDPRDMRDLDYEVVLAPGTMAGMDNETIAETYKEFLVAGKIDMKTYATIANLPKKQSLLDILDQNDQTQQKLTQLLQEVIQLKTQFAPNSITDDEINMAKQMGIQ